MDGELKGFLSTFRAIGYLGILRGEWEKEMDGEQGMDGE